MAREGRRAWYPLPLLLSLVTFHHLPRRLKDLSSSSISSRGWGTDNLRRMECRRVSRASRVVMDEGMGADTLSFFAPSASFSSFCTSSSACSCPSPSPSLARSLGPEQCSTRPRCSTSKRVLTCATRRSPTMEEGPLSSSSSSKVGSAERGRQSRSRRKGEEEGCNR